MFYCEVFYRLPICSSAELGAREFRRMLKAAWNECGWYLFEHFTQKHFTTAGGKEYGYALRAGEEGGLSGAAFLRSYFGQKIKQTHQNEPFVWSGRTRDGARHCRIYPSSKGVRITLPGLVYLNQYKPADRKDGSPSPVDLREELLRISPAEIAEIIPVHERSMRAQLGNRSQSYVVQIK